MKRSVEWLTVAGALSVTAGVSLASFLFGALTAPYYAAIFFSLMLLFPIVSRQVATRAIDPSLFIVLLIVPVALWSAQGLFVSEASPQLTSLAFTLAMGVTIFLAAGIGSLRPTMFRRTMAIVAVLHILICVYTLRDYKLILLQSQWRYYDENFSTAVWAELALGTVIAAILAERRLLILLATVVGMVLIVATQMRGAGLAMVTGLAVYIWMSTAHMTWLRQMVMMVLLAIGVYAVIDPGGVYDVIAQVLLLENRHRGIDSGFSGRFDNITDGWEIFLKSPLIGVGPSHDIAGHTHNGVIKALAEYGMFYSGLLLVILLYAMQRAWDRRHAALVATLVAYVLFITTAPRYINFQVMPFLGLVAAAFALITLEKPARRAAAGRRLASQPGGAVGHGLYGP